MSNEKSHTENEEILSFDEKTKKLREEAALEHRNWVRITYACNNRCIFCLDSEVPKLGHRDEKPVKQEIKEGFKPDARLILSGGEASIHPKFPEFVRYGRKIGYGWIQTISNGRMFAYPDFVKTVADNGLNEVTFSMHGHTSELHDELTGIKGGFAHALKGMVNLLKDGRVVVNVDVVINGLNYMYLEDILKFYMRLGIHEFDLLHIVPFGRAWENRERLMFEMKDAFPYLNKAFKMAYRPGNFIWTNRLPVAVLEGVEELIQDPHKLYDEMNGRRKEFNHFIETGEKLVCFGERCDYCFIKPYCHTLYETREKLEAGGFGRIVATASDETPLPEGVLLEKLIEQNPDAEWALNCEDAKMLMRLAKRLPQHAKIRSVQLEDWSESIEHLEQLTKTFQAIKEALCVASEKEQIEALLKAGRKVIWQASNENAALLTDNERSEDWFTERQSGGRVVGILYPSFETLGEARSHLPEPVGFFSHLPKEGIFIEGVPECLHPKALREKITLDMAMLDKEGKIDIEAFTKSYILHQYFVHSNRCDACLKRSICKGLHINAIRAFGFQTLTPIQ